MDWKKISKSKIAFIIFLFVLFGFGIILGSIYFSIVSVSLILLPVSLVVKMKIQYRLLIVFVIILMWSFLLLFIYPMWFH